MLTNHHQCMQHSVRKHYTSSQTAPGNYSYIFSKELDGLDDCTICDMMTTYTPFNHIWLNTWAHH